MFPAYAGVIPDIIVDRFDIIGVPRVCGGDPDIELRYTANQTCSPRMRG